jgi:hypothetical protein
MIKRVFPLDPFCYQRHEIHACERQWAETNCYVDVWIELLHAWGFEPIAALPFTLAIDFEGDQWTFFKFPLSDLYSLYGIDVQELQIWRPLVDHIEEQVSLGRPILVELDSFYLPDTIGTAYHMAHVKSTVAVIEVDVAERRLGYFHGQSYYHLFGDDFANVLHLNGPPHSSVLPPYVEIAKRHERSIDASNSTICVSIELLRAILRRLPDVNPFDKFRSRFEIDRQWLANEPIDTFHQYSFATLRQFGACYELTATYLRWLQSRAISGLERPLELFDGLSNQAKRLQFQLARAMARKKDVDLTPIDQMAQMWRIATDDLKARFLTSN